MLKVGQYTLPVAVAAIAVFLNIENATGLLLAFTIVLYLILIKRQLGKAVLLIMIGGFLLRVAVAFLDQNLHVFPYVWDLYFPVASQIHQNLSFGYPLYYDVSQSLNVLSYSSFAAFLYAIFGKYQLIVRIFNSLWGVLVVERTFNISRVIFKKDKAALLAASFVSFFPSFIIFSSLDMRDAIILFFSTDFLWRICEISYLKRRRLLIVLIDVFMLSILRVQNIILLAGIFATFVMILGFIKTPSKYRMIYSSFVLILGGVGIFLLQKIGILNFIFTYIQHDLITRSAGGSVYLAGKFYNTWADVLIWAPLRFLHFTFGPFLWSVKNSFMLIGIFESFIIIICFIGFIIFLKRLELQRNVILLFLIWVMVLGLLGNAIVDSNYGTAIRHRMNYVLIIFILGTPFLTSLRFRLFKPES